MKKIAIALALLPLTACIGVLIAVQLLPDRSTSSTSTDIGEQIADVPGPLSPESVATTKAESTGSSGSPLFLGDYCPETLGEAIWSDEKCLDAVEQHFMEKAAYTIEMFGVIPKDGPFTFRTMFDNLERDIELVMEALSRQECRLLEGPIRLDLRETCNVDAFFRLGLYSQFCARAEGILDNLTPHESPFPDDNARALYEDAVSQYRNELRQYWEETGGRFDEDGSPKVKWDDERIENFREFERELRAKHGIDSLYVVDDGLSNYQRSLDESTDRWFWDHEREREDWTEWDDYMDMYWAVRNRMRERALQSVWLDARGLCPSHLTQDSLPTPEASPPDEEVLRWWNDNRKDGFAYEQLLAIAGRLGNERVILDSHFYHSFRIAFQESKRELFPWLEQLDLALWHVNIERPKSLMHLAPAMVGLRKAGYEVDLDKMVSYMCHLKPRNREVVQDCATAIREAEESMDNASVEELRILDEIEATAIKLGIYQY